MLNNEAQVKQLKTEIERITKLDVERLIERPDKWAELNLKSSEKAIRGIFDMILSLNTLPTDNLPGDVATQIQQKIQPLANTFEEIDKTTVSGGGDLKAKLNEFSTRCQSHYQELYKSVSPWIPFLAYSNGDVKRNIEALRSAIQTGTQDVEKAKGEIAKQKIEIDGILTKAREAAAQAGAGVFTKDFETEAAESASDAVRWLKAAIGVGAIGLLVAIVFLVLAFCMDMTGAKAAQILVAKIAILAIIFTAALWCGRNYKACRHLAILNKHRANTLKSVQAFHGAAIDPQIKDGIVHEAAKSVYGHIATGYVNPGQGDNEVTVFEMARGAVSSKG